MKSYRLAKVISKGMIEHCSIADCIYNALSGY